MNCIKKALPFVCTKYTRQWFVYFSEKVEQYEAVSRCKNRGMWLATIENEDDVLESRRVIAEARLAEMELDYETQTWIGLQNNGDGWKWVMNGSTAYFTNWWQGNYYEEAEPNNNYKGQPVESCVEMSLEGTWNDQICECEP